MKISINDVFATAVIIPVAWVLIWACSKAIEDSEILAAQMAPPPAEWKITTNSTDPTIKAMTTGLAIGPRCSWYSLHFVEYDVVQLDQVTTNIRQQWDWVAINNQLTTLTYGKVKTHVINNVKAANAIDPSKTLPGWGFGVVNAGPYEIGVAYKDLGGYYQVSFCKFMKWK